MGHIKSNVGGKVSAMLLAIFREKSVPESSQGTGDWCLSAELPILFLMTRGLSQADGCLYQNRKQRTFGAHMSTTLSEQWYDVTEGDMGPKLERAARSWIEPEACRGQDCFKSIGSGGLPSPRALLWGTQ